LARYLAELDRWRRAANLTGDLSGPDLADHALESLAGSQLIPENAEVIDIGSGAGLPGVPLAIVRPDLRMTLLEPRTRRAAFLRHVARTVPVENVSVLEGRVEDLAAGAWTVATTRALGNLGRLLGVAAFLRPAGLLLSWTNDPDALSAALAPLFVLVQAERLPRRGAIAILRKASS
jgi:16S rRNA (guanine(527)-N(7))-methyltransferase RsmG